MVALGVLGYILRKMHFPSNKPLITGFVLGEMLEQNLRRALSISNGNIWRFLLAKQRCQSPADHGDHGHCRTASVTSDRKLTAVNRRLTPVN